MPKAKIVKVLTETKVKKLQFNIKGQRPKADSLQKLSLAKKKSKCSTQ
ncbi:unnamed protein product [Rhodiola kirilowii]